MSISKSNKRNVRGDVKARMEQQDEVLLMYLQGMFVDFDNVPALQLEIKRLKMLVKKTMRLIL